MKEEVTFNLARLKKNGKTFEIVVDPDLAIKYKQEKKDSQEGKSSVDIKDVLKSEKVFSDAKKGELAPGLKEMFDTEDVIIAADAIIMAGEIQLTAEHRAKVREQKRKQIINMIHRNGVDPRTHLPHPIVRIENAMEEAKFKIDENAKAEDQVQTVLKALRPILPIRFETKEIAVHIPTDSAGKAYTLVKQFGKLLQDAWQNDGSWIGVVEVPGGLEAEFFDKLNSITHGNMESKIVKTKE